MELSHHARADGRLSDILKNEMGVSSGLMNRLKWDGRIRVNGQAQRTDFRVKAGDRVSLILDEPEPDYPAQEMELTILYEDEHLLAVDKPAGMLIHPSRSANMGTLANGIVWHYGQTGQRSAFHPVTRLDRDTYGVTLIAKNSHIHALMQGGDVQKYYHALVFGGPERDSGVIDAPIDRRPLPSLLRYVAETGKPSVTEYRVLERFGGHSLLELKPVTGRTHQLRVHCSYMGWPILGDPQYAAEDSRVYSEKLGLTYQRLCAKRVEFTHPLTGERLTIESKLGATL